jgi:CBS domain-containing protein
MLACQKQGQPVHRWPLIETDEAEGWEQGYRTIGQFMSTDLFTVQPDDLIDLAASVMDWRHIRHVPVEDESGRMVGLVTHRGLLHLLINRIGTKEVGAITVKEIMVPNPLTVSPSTPTLVAVELMREHRIGCLPVVEDDQLVGIVTSYDFLNASARLFQQHLTAIEAAQCRSRAQSA